MKRLTVVVPCYNEADRLQVDRFLHFAQQHPEIEFLTVDDGSRDATPEVLSRLCELCPGQFRTHRLAINQGKAEAVRQGMLAALSSGSEYVAFIDADLATPLDELPRMMAVLDSQQPVKMVLGSRVRLLGRRIERRPSRYWLGRCFATAASCVLGTRIYDTQCGLKMFRSSPLTRQLFATGFTSRWLFDVECLARFISERGRTSTRNELYEMPLNQWFEIPGSRIKSADFVKAIGELFGIYWKYRSLMTTSTQLESDSVESVIPITVGQSATIASSDENSDARRRDAA